MTGCMRMLASDRMYERTLASDRLYESQRMLASDRL